MIVMIDDSSYVSQELSLHRAAVVYSPQSEPQRLEFVCSDGSHGLNFSHVPACHHIDSHLSMLLDSHKGCKHNTGLTRADLVLQGYTIDCCPGSVVARIHNCRAVCYKSS